MKTPNSRNFVILVFAQLVVMPGFGMVKPSPWMGAGAVELK